MEFKQKMQKIRMEQEAAVIKSFNQSALSKAFILIRNRIMYIESRVSLWMVFALKIKSMIIEETVCASRSKIHQHRWYKIKSLLGYTIHYCVAEEIK